MSKRMREILTAIETLQNEAKAFRDEKKFEEAQKKLSEIAELKKEYEVEKGLFEADQARVPDETGTEKKTADSLRAVIKAISGMPLDDTEKSLLLPTSSNTNGAKGEGYILPQDIRTQIVKKIRDYKSFRDVLGYLPAGALTGSFPVEGFETLTGLADFADGTDGTDVTDIEFKNVSFSLKEKAAFIKLSNTLLSLTDNALIAYVAEVFAKKAVITENAMAIATLKNGKTAKALADWKALKSSLNKDLDPAVLYGTVIVTNQTGYDYLDKQLDTTGRPILTQDVAAPGVHRFAGYDVIVFSDSLLPSTAATTSKPEKTPFFYGNLREAVCFVDLNGLISFATSTEAGFMSNTTVARLIEFIDVIQKDSSDKIYIYGEVETAPKTSAS